MAPNHESKVESEDERRSDAHRRVAELSDEIRIALPGVQVLFAFLLTLPFSGQFNEITERNQTTYFAAFMSAAVASMLLIAPSAMHRIQHGDGGDRHQYVAIATILAIAGTIFLAFSMSAVVFLVSDVLYDATTASIAAGGVAGLAVLLWFVAPIVMRVRNSGRVIPKDLT
jgi:hypothetical protein